MTQTLPLDKRLPWELHPGASVFVSVIALMILFAMHYELSMPIKCRIFTVFEPLIHFSFFQQRDSCYQRATFVCTPKRTVTVCA